MVMIKIANMLRTRSAIRHFRRPSGYNEKSSEGYKAPKRPHVYEKPKKTEEGWKPAKPDYAIKKPKGFLQQVSEFLGFGNQNSSEKKSSEFTDVELDEKIRYGSTLPKDSTSKMHCSWATTDLESFKEQIDSKGTLMNLIAIDWLKSDRVLHGISSSPGGIVQRYADQGLPEFFIVFNIQGPGASKFHLILYYVMKAPVGGLLQRFINGDDEFRTSSLYFCSHVHGGNPIFAKAVKDMGPIRIGENLHISYVRGTNYLEIEIDVSSSRLATAFASKVFTGIYYLFVDVAFIIKDINHKEVPVTGTARLTRLNTNKAVNVDMVN